MTSGQLCNVREGSIQTLPHAYEGARICKDRKRKEEGRRARVDSCACACWQPFRTSGDSALGDVSLRSLFAVNTGTFATLGPVSSSLPWRACSTPRRLSTQ